MFNREKRETTADYDLLQELAARRDNRATSVTETAAFAGVVPSPSVAARASLADKFLDDLNYLVGLDAISSVSAKEQFFASIARYIAGQAISMVTYSDRPHAPIEDAIIITSAGRAYWMGGPSGDACMVITSAATDSSEKVQFATIESQGDYQYLIDIIRVVGKKTSMLVSHSFIHMDDDAVHHDEPAAARTAGGSRRGVLGMIRHPYGLSGFAALAVALAIGVASYSDTRPRGPEAHPLSSGFGQVAPAFKNAANAAPAAAPAMPNGIHFQVPGNKGSNGGNLSIFGIKAGPEVTPGN